jgi:succinate-semialdehyde dehydrogenase/glutarate-semialdehyde dehydrogenase
MLIFMQLSTQLYIDGKWVNGAATMPVTNPADGLLAVILVIVNATSLSICTTLTGSTVNL